MIRSVTQSKWFITDFSEDAVELTGSIYCHFTTVYCTGNCHCLAHEQSVQEISHETQPTTSSKIGRDH